MNVFICLLVFSFSICSNLLIEPSDSVRSDALRKELEAAKGIELQKIPQEFVDANFHHIRDESALIALAYGLNNSQMPAVWHGMCELVAEQYMADEAFKQPFDPNASETEIFERLNSYAANMPMRPENMCHIAEKILGPGDYVVQRREFGELRRRRQRIVEAIDDETTRNATAYAWLKKAREDRACYFSAAMKPMPVMEFMRLAYRDKALSEAQLNQRESSRQLDNRSIVYPGRDAIQRMERQHSITTEDDISETKEDNLRIVWDQALANCLSSATDPNRKSIAEKTAADLWKRVEKFRAKRKADYKAIEDLTSKREYRQARAKLEAPAQALLLELRERLESLCGA